MVDIDVLKVRADEVVTARSEELVAVSRALHSHPELAFAEHRAHDLLADILERSGLEVERGTCGIPTAFAGRAGSSGPTVAVLCEYDALPGIGHACGHNVIGAAGVGAAIAAAAVADEAGGRVLVLGTPAEEGGGGKVGLAVAGAFDDVDAALMVHPAGLDLARITAIAIQQVHVTYHGRAAHAAAAPHVGRNALDAAVLGYQAVAALRQHIRPDERVHGIFTDGGEAPNVVPARAAMHWYVRSPTVDGLTELKQRVLAALESGASATGCTMEHTWVDPAYANMVDNEAILERYRLNSTRSGRAVIEPRPDEAVVGSTDMGNISHLVPSIHPMIAVSTPGVPIHTTEFARFAGSESGDGAVLDGARTMAATVIDLWAQPGLLDEVRREFEDQKAAGVVTGRPTV